MSLTRRSFALAVPALLLGSCASTPDWAEPDSDAPAWRPVRPQDGPPPPPDYGAAVRQWRTPEDVNAWMGAHFEYDMPRALKLSETQRTVGSSLPIHAPEQFFKDPKGVCVDLTRFAVETLQKISPDLTASYLMIEFDPITLGDKVLRRHWVASFNRDGKLYYFADSKRPGHMAGPYATAAEFIAEYAQYRRRQILGFKALPTYQRQMKNRAKKPSLADN